MSLCRSRLATPSSASALGSKAWGSGSRRATPTSLLSHTVRRGRRGRVTVDYAQNSVERNTAAPYTLCARPTHPTASTPLTWEDLEAGTIQPADLTPQVVLERVGRLGDVYAPVLQADQHIS